MSQIPSLSRLPRTCLLTADITSTLTSGFRASHFRPASVSASHFVAARSEEGQAAIHSRGTGTLLLQLRCDYVLIAFPAVSSAQFVQN